MTMWLTMVIRLMMVIRLGFSANLAPDSWAPVGSGAQFAQNLIQMISLVLRLMMTMMMLIMMMKTMTMTMTTMVDTAMAMAAVHLVKPNQVYNKL